MTIKERLDALREKMGKRDIEAYIISSSDAHQSEYVADHYKSREFMSGFTGSAGSLVVTRRGAGLWTDSRYFLQAEKQLEGSGIDLYRMGLDMSLEDFLLEEVSPFGKIGFDGSCISYAKYRELAGKLGKRAFVTDVDYVGEIWEDRPGLPEDPAFVLDLKYAGSSVSDKIKILRFMMRERELDYCFISAPEDICYLLNIRGHDIKDTPVVLSYCLVSMEDVGLFIDDKKLTKEVRDHLEELAINIHPYENVGKLLEEIPGQKTVHIDPTRTSVNNFFKFRENVKIQTSTNLTSLMKAIKNETEIKNLREAFLKDGVALVQFFNWIETGAWSGSLNERAAVGKLHEFRSKQEGFIEDSFDAIIAYGPNAAVVHYNPLNSKPSTTIYDRGMVLVDSGGHYLEGTTDITRTVATGVLKEEEKEDYTLVLKAHIAGMRAIFPKGTSGTHVSSVTLAPLYQKMKKYGHGTGHGVGYLLSVHEGPQSFSNSPAANKVELAPGMVTSMEPGLYIKDSHGIRIESITLVKEVGQNDFGTWYGLECLTWVPIDTRPVKLELLNDEELDWLNDYNAKCFEKLSPRLEGEDLRYLTEICKEVKKK